MTANTGRRAALAVSVLLFVNGGMAEDACRDRSVPGNDATSYLSVEISDHSVTLQARNAGVNEVLEALARDGDLLVVADGSLPGRLTLEFARLPLYEAVRRIMRGRSYLLQQARPATAASNAVPEPRSTLWVFTGEAADETGHEQAAGRSSPATAAVIEALQSQLKSDDVRIRQEAIKGLRRLAGNEVVAPLSYALADADKNIRVKAIYALADVGGDNAVAAVASAAADENAWVRAEMAYALGTLGGRTAIEVLKHTLHDADSDVRESAIEAFSDIGGAQSAAALAVVLQDADTSLRVAAVEALADIGGATALHLLRQALEDRDSVVRKTANEALAELSGEDP